MKSVRKIYVMAIIAAIIAAFTSFFPNGLKVFFFLIAIIVDAVVNKDSALKSKPLQLLFVFYFISFFYVYILERGHFTEIRNVLLPYSIMLMCFWIAPGLMKLNKKEAMIICCVFVFCLVENLIATAYIGKTEPWIIRYNFSGIEGEADTIIARAYSRLGLLSYQSSHLLSMLSTLLVMIAFETKKFWIRLPVLLMSALAVYVMYIMTITTALLLGLLCISVMTVFYLTKGKMKRSLLSFSVLCIFLLSSGVLTNWLLSSGRGDNNEIAVKLNDVGESIVTGSSQGQVASRGNEYNLTWEAISRNPIFGGSNGPEDTGQHTLFLDYWAYYGVFSLVLFVGWWKEVKRMKKKLNKKMWNAYLICLLPIVLTCFLKGPVFLPYYILATLVILRIAFLAFDLEKNQLYYVKKI